ncbi:MAG: hypothetical protein AAF658_00065, partial [Myxococcota bacterium]
LSLSTDSVSGVRTWNEIEPLAFEPGVTRGPLERHAAAYSTVDGGILIQGGTGPTGTRNETWLLDVGDDDRPVHIFQIALADTALNSLTVRDVRINATVGGEGSGDAGAQLWLWDYDHWRAVEGQNDAPATTPAALSWSLAADNSASDVISGGANRLLLGNEDTITVAVTTRALGGTSFSTIATDYIEGTICYQRD